jgi:hypothetical protein
MAWLHSRNLGRIGALGTSRRISRASRFMQVAA